MDPTINVYEYTLPGFDGGSSKTDHLVRWVAAPSREIAAAYATSKWPGCTDYANIWGAGREEDGMHIELFNEGVDVMIYRDGRTITP